MVCPLSFCHTAQEAHNRVLPRFLVYKENMRPRRKHAPLRPQEAATRQTAERAAARLHLLRLEKIILIFLNIFLIYLLTNRKARAIIRV